MSSDLPPGSSPPENGSSGDDGGRYDGKITELPIEDELKGSYLTYAMSVIVSRALPDVRDGLKPSQRRILVAMNDLNLGPASQRVKCAKISGDTSGNYHPHGEAVIYPTLVHMAQDWKMRHVLVDKQGNFGSIAGLPPAQMRYTEARLSSAASAMLDDIKLDTVDYVPTYDERGLEPTVLPARFPNLLVNGSDGIAVGMRTSLPPHNLREVCDALFLVLDNPETPIDQIMEVLPGPDFPTGGVICGRAGIRKAYYTGRSNIVIRARAKVEERKKDRYQIRISEIPYQRDRDSIVAKLDELRLDGRVQGIASITDLSDLKRPVDVVVDVKNGHDPDVVLNQLYSFSQLQSTFSMIFLALVDGKPRELSIKQMLLEWVRHRITVIRRRTQFLLAKARRRKHTVEGLLLALVNIDEIIKIIRTSETQVEAKERLGGVECPAAMLQRALGDDGFALFQDERGAADVYYLTPVQADEILRMRLGQLVNLEQEKLSDEHKALLTEIKEYLRILSDEANIRAIIKEEIEDIRKKHGNPRRTEISGEELGAVDLEDLITEENMVVTITHNGYIKRTPASTYRAQRRGGKGIKGATTEGADPVEHLFVASTHAYLMFFTNKGQVYWQKVYDLPQLSRESRGRAIVNLLQLTEGEAIADCRAVKDFDVPDHYLIMATAKGLVKKTELKAYRRPMKKGIIAIKLKDDDELRSVVVAEKGDELVCATSSGMAIRFSESDLRAMGRNTSGVRGVRLGKDDQLMSMVVADPEATLLTVCEHGYGKRTFFGPNAEVIDDGDAENGDENGSDADNGGEEDEVSSSARYRTQKRGGKGVRDIKTTKRNGPVVGAVRVTDDDEVIMMTARGKLQRLAASDISVIGRNTQGVRIMGLDKGDTLAAVVRVPHEENEDEVVGAPSPDAVTDSSAKDAPAASDDETPADDSEE